MKQQRDRRCWASEATWISKAGLPRQLQDQPCAHRRAGSAGVSGEAKPLMSWALPGCVIWASHLTIPCLPFCTCETRLIMTPSHTTGDRIKRNKHIECLAQCLERGSNRESRKWAVVQFYVALGKSLNLLEPQCLRRKTGSSSFPTG